MSNIDKFFNEDPWQELTAPCYPEGRRLYLPDDRFWVSVNSDNRVMFFVHEPGIQAVKPPKNMSSVDVEVARYGDDASRLSCTLVDDDDDVRSKFSVVAKDIAHSCALYSGPQLFTKIIERISSWSDFLKPKKTGLSGPEYIGLVGELYALLNIFMEEHPPTDATRFWVGPDNKKQDFTLNSIAIEVKASFSGGPGTVKISSLDQLDAITAQLYLLRMVFNPSNSGESVTLKQLYDQCVARLDYDIGGKALFLQKASALYGRASDAQLEEMLALVKISLYEVTKEFPKLISKDVLPGIVAAAYEISVSSISSYEIHGDIAEIISNG